jgi:hypothetical protein
VIDYHPDHVRRRLLLVAHEDFSAADILQSVERRLREGTWQYTVLLDLRRRKHALSRADILLIVNRVNEVTKTRGRPGPMAILVGDLVGFGMARMYSLYGENTGRTVEVFREAETAERWFDAHEGSAGGQLTPQGVRRDAQGG